MHPLDSVQALPAFVDNYIWTWSSAGHAVVVDPGDAGPVMAYLRDSALALGAILVTHHHPDHTHGIAELRAQWPDVPVYGPADGPFRDITHPLRDGDTITVQGVPFSIIATPGHTLDHICYFHPQALFCGDTLFAGGCGRLFEGTAAQMHASLTRLAGLPADTPVYCTHEYTLANLRFACAARPDHAPTRARHDEVVRLRDAGRISLPSTIGDEQAINPFLNVDAPDLRDQLRTMGGTASSDVDAFAELRAWKDRFRG